MPLSAGCAAIVASIEIGVVIPIVVGNQPRGCGVLGEDQGVGAACFAGLNRSPCGGISGTDLITGNNIDRHAAFRREVTCWQGNNAADGVGGQQGQIDPRVVVPTRQEGGATAVFQGAVLAVVAIVQKKPAAPIGVRYPPGSGVVRRYGQSVNST